MVDTGTTYYGVVVPQNDNVIPGKFSKEFCFNFSTQEYAEGADCETFKLPEGVKVASLSDPLSTEMSDEDLEHDAAGADMKLSHVSHTVQGNVITLTWTVVAGSENLEIRLFDKQKADFIPLATVPMSQGKYEYTYDNTTQEFIFAFIPRDSKGKEARYDVNVRQEADVKPEIKDIPATGPVENMLVMVALTLALYAGYRVVVARKA